MRKKQIENKKKVAPEISFPNENVVEDKPIIINIDKFNIYEKENNLIISDNSENIIIDIIPEDKPEVKLESNVKLKYKSMDDLTKQEMRMYRRTGVLPKIKDENF